MKILTPDSEQPEQPEGKSGKKRILYKKLFQRLLLLIFAGVFLLSLLMLATRLYAYYKENKSYESIRASIQTPIPGFVNPARDPAGIGGEPESSTEPDAADNRTSPLPLPYTVLKGDPNELDPEGILKFYSALKAQNTDLAGWISMPGFQKVIDYPIMKCADNEFYLTHDFYKNRSYSGSIFMDAGNRSSAIREAQSGEKREGLDAPGLFVSEPDRNIILYGHAMKDMSMFGNLKDYPGNEEKYGKNTVIYLDLLDMQLEYRVFSAYSTESSFNYRRTTFVDDADYLGFLETIKGKSEHDFGISLSPLDRIITLSTCDESYGKDGRTVIHAKLVKQIVYGESGSEGDYAKADGESDKKIISSNVYLEKLSLQYQIPNADDNQNDANTQALTQPALGKSPDNEPAPATDSSKVPGSSPKPDTSHSPDPSPAPDAGKADMSSEGQWADAVLDPPFTITAKVFSTRVPAAADVAKLTVTAADPKASLSYVLNGNAADPGRLALTEGDNVITVRVVSIDGLYVRTYTIHVLREPSPTTPPPEQTPAVATDPAPALKNQP